jgi:intein/homing endonuclease
MPIYDFNKTGSGGGGTPVEIETQELKVGDIIITNRENEFDYEDEGVELLRLTEYNQIVNAYNYPKLALLEDYQYNAEIVSTSFISDTNITIDNFPKFFLQDEENTFLMFANGDTVFKKINSDNTISTLLTGLPNFQLDLAFFVNFDNFTKVLCLYKQSNAIKVIIYNKITNTISVSVDLVTSLAATGNVFAARLMPDGLIYIGVLTSLGNVSIFRTSDGIVFENYYTSTLTHWSINFSNHCCFDERGSMNFDDNYNLYFLQQNGTNRTLGYFNLITKQKVNSIHSFTTASNLALYFGVNIKNNQILLFQSQVSNVLNLIIFDKLEGVASSRSISLNNTTAVDTCFIIDYDKIFIYKNGNSELVYVENFTTQYNYQANGSIYRMYITLDFRYNNIKFLYKNTTGTNTRLRNIATVKVAETLLIPKQVYSGYQANSYLVTDVPEEGV